LWGFIGGILAWFATNFLGQPIVAFIAARNDAARILAQFASLDHYDPEIDKFPDNLVEERQKSLSIIGAQLIAFAHSNQFFVPILHRLHFFPQSAGNTLILLSQMKPTGVNNHDTRQQILQQLRLGRGFRGVRCYRG
jgi:hypothetical protein